MDNKPTGILDPRWIEHAQEMRRRKQEYEWKHRNDYADWWNKKYGNK